MNILCLTNSGDVSLPFKLKVVEKLKVLLQFPRQFVHELFRELEQEDLVPWIGKPFALLRTILHVSQQLSFLKSTPYNTDDTDDHGTSVFVEHRRMVFGTSSINVLLSRHYEIQECGGAHSYRNCRATDGNVYRDNIQEYVSQTATVNYNQGNAGYQTSDGSNANSTSARFYLPIQRTIKTIKEIIKTVTIKTREIITTKVLLSTPRAYKLPAPQTQGVSKDDFQNYIKANDAVMKNMQDQNQNMQNQMTNLTEMLTKFMNANSASTSGSGSLPSNTVANPRVPSLPSSLPKVVEHEPEVTKDKVQPSTENIQPPEVQTQNDEPVVAPKTKLNIPYPSRINKEKLREKDDLLFAPMFRKLLNNKDKIIDLIRTPVNGNCSAVILKKFLEKLGDPGRFLIPCDFSEMDECLALADLGASINLMPLSSGNSTPTLEPILSTSPTSLTPFKGGDFILEEIKACLTSKSIPPGIDDDDFDPKEDLLTLERLLNSDPTSTLPSKEQKIEELKTVEPSIDELPELELKDLPPHLEYAFLEGIDKLPVIIATDLKDEDKTTLLKVLRSHKRAIA
ncbi:hypothetical protein Tco_0520901 [Tanacetum coccineum]